MDRWNNYFSEQLIRLDKEHNKRTLSTAKQPVNLSGNDYLALGNNQELRDRFYKDMSTHPAHFALGSGSSRLLTGNHDAYEPLEQLLSSAYKKDKSLVFSSGYHANSGIIPALISRNDAILSDKLNHASIIDGAILSRASLYRYRHNDTDHLRQLAQKARKQNKRMFIITESIFSMDGDCAPLEDIIALKKEFDAFLIVDEAHAVGTRGTRGLGLAEERNLLEDIDLIIGTFGKALAGHGAFCVGSRPVIEWLINRARSLIFTTALPPVIVHWNHLAFSHAMKMTEERTYLAELSRFTAEQLAPIGVRTHSHIIPVILGENNRAIAVAQEMRQRGYTLFPVRPPTVPTGSARLRISLHTGLTTEIVTDMTDSLLGYIEHYK